MSIAATSGNATNIIPSPRLLDRLPTQKRLKSRPMGGFDFFPGVSRAGDALCTGGVSFSLRLAGPALPSVPAPGQFLVTEFTPRTVPPPERHPRKATRTAHE
ncbi:hypothetical protein GCM10027590_60020 [Nocardiopsis nanhaiensis]